MVTAAIKLKDACPLEGKLTNLDSILNSRDTTLPTKVHLVKGMVFLLVMYRYESWTIKKAEYWCFWTAVLEKTLESPLNLKEIKPVNPKGNQSWIFIGRTDAEVPILGHLMPRTDSLERLCCWARLKAGGEGDNRRWDGWMASLTRQTWIWTSSGSWWWTGKPGMLQSMGSQWVKHDWVTEPNWIPWWLRW